MKLIGQEPSKSQSQSMFTCTLRFPTGYFFKSEPGITHKYEILVVVVLVVVVVVVMVVTQLGHCCIRSF